MLVYANGDIEGTVGGGAFEYEVVKQAVDVLKVGKAKRIVLNLHFRFKYIYPISIPPRWVR